MRIEIRARRPVERGPQRAVGQCAPGGGNQRAAEAEGVDDQIERPGHGAVGEHDVPSAIAIAWSGRHRASSLYLDTGPNHGLIENIKQCGAMNADAERGVIQRGITHVEHGATRGNGFAKQAVDAGAGCKHVPIKLQRTQHREAGGLDHQARAKRLRGGKPLEQRDAMAIAMQQQCCRQPRHATPRHPDCLNVHVMKMR